MRGERELDAFVRGEGPCPGIATLHMMPKDRDYSPQLPKNSRGTPTRQEWVRRTIGVSAGVYAARR